MIISQQRTLFLFVLAIASVSNVQCEMSFKTGELFLFAVTFPFFLITHIFLATCTHYGIHFKPRKYEHYKIYHISLIFRNFDWCFRDFSCCCCCCMSRVVCHEFFCLDDIRFSIGQHTHYRHNQHKSIASKYAIFYYHSVLSTMPNAKFLKSEKKSCNCCNQIVIFLGLTTVNTTLALVAALGYSQIIHRIHRSWPELQDIYCFVSHVLRRKLNSAHSNKIDEKEASGIQSRTSRLFDGLLMLRSFKQFRSSVYCFHTWICVAFETAYKQREPFFVGNVNFPIRFSMNTHFAVSMVDLWDSDKL